MVAETVADCGSGARDRGFVSLLGLALVGLSLWNARTDLRMAVKEGTTTFIQDRKNLPARPRRAL